MCVWRCVGLCLTLLALTGCIGQATSERSAFLTAAETFGVSMAGEDEDGEGGAGGTAAEAGFRPPMTLVLANNEWRAELNTAWVAWVELGSIRSAEQQDALLSDGYVQLTREVSLGTAFTLRPGTFVYNGPGVAGATLVRIDPGIADEGQNAAVTATEVSFEFITPDVLLVFSQPPVSCDTPAYFFTLDGQPFDIAPQAQNLGAEFSGATGRGSVKTLAQIDVYECSPFRPGLFLRTSGGAVSRNEYFEGQNVRIDFFRIPDAQENAAFVTISD